MCRYLDFRGIVVSVRLSVCMSVAISGVAMYCRTCQPVCTYLPFRGIVVRCPSVSMMIPTSRDIVMSVRQYVCIGTYYRCAVRNVSFFVC